MQESYSSGTVTITPPLTGTEKVVIDNGGAVTATCTTQEIADLGGGGEPTQNTAITTVGAGTLTAAAIAGGLITRTGPTGAFNDTTATALQIVAAIPGAVAGQSFVLTIKNGTAFSETLLAGAGVTLPGAIVVGPNSTAQYLVTLTSLAAVTFTHISTQFVDAPPGAQFATAALAAGTLAAGLITGAAIVVLQNTGATPGAQTTRTAAQMLADFPQARVGMSYLLRIVNTGAGTLTLTADGSVTITGTATVAQNVFRDYIVTFNTATTATFQSVGSGTSP
jgi:hypothetical protein